MKRASNLTSGCAAHHHCSSCTDSSDCVWCDSHDYCRDGGFFGADDDGCDNWRWKQCSIDGLTLLIICGCSIGVLLLLILIIVVWCCCCRKKKKKSYETIGDDGIDPYYDDPDYAMDNDNYVSSTPKTDQARKEMNEKWGIGSRSLDEARAKLDQRDGYQA
eukprot:CAMPEP_0201546550 /NCGR_PEP_ID=MMETSP0173_2-20130828/2804_1 /ASSEMBLY_ACC=CAM_ASM_000268 /TAXON_ID=218659 /ORGANISM="Vexillifera sp., Strain DIVA3 564/2" /LENGTH=160 /DNA_ID=CAMNT_0047955229 /DNA_START=158 /DNA_END=643 /DNA_ORIENTATION=-